MTAKLRNNCVACKLSRFRFKIVQGRGSIPADLMFMGEAPGKTEDLKGEAFVGKAGKLLDMMIEDAVGLLERENGLTVILPSYYITNTVLCRPTDYLMGGNREPEPEEVLACRNNIMDIFERVNPKLVVFLGKVAQSYYEKVFTESIHIIHPAALLRQGKKRSPLYKPNVRRLSEGILWLLGYEQK